MTALTRYLKGEFAPKEIGRYLAFVAAAFWGTIVLAWMSYPAEHHYSIMTHTFSFLGSFNPEHNPGHWYFFTIAMAFWGLATVPITLYIRRRFAAISPWASCVGAFLMFLGCLGVILVAAFPDARGPVIGAYQWTQIHEKAAVLIAIGFTLANVWHGLLILKDRFLRKEAAGPSPFNHRKLLWPYLFWMAVTGTGVSFQLRWGSIYAARKALAAASGQHVGSSWSEALGTRYSFPLWENIVIYALFIFLIWFTAAVPREVSAKRSGSA